MSTMYAETDLRTQLYFLHLFGYWDAYLPKEDDDSESDSDNGPKALEDDPWRDYQFPKPLIYLRISLFGALFLLVHSR